MKLNITSGRRMTPPKVVLYGPEGIGKSTLASRFRRPLFLDLERGTSRLDVARIEVAWDSLSSVTGVLAELAKDHGDFETVVIDTADYLDGLIIEDVCRVHNKRSIADFDFGKGYDQVYTQWQRLLDSLARLQTATGMGVVFVAHAWQRKVQQPEDTGDYDHWELKMSKKAGPLLKEWADFLLFVRYDITVVEDKGRNRASGGQRTVCTSHTPFYDAKSRQRLPPTFPLRDDTVRELMSAVYMEGDLVAAAAAAQAPEPEPKTKPVPAFVCRREPVEASRSPEPETPPDPPSNSPQDLGARPVVAERFPGQTERLGKLNDIMALHGVSLA
ncbi:MAG: ATP-binding protein, partial [Oligosphaeraceae bacterium]